MSYFKDNRSIGCFQHKETGVWFEFRPTEYWFALKNDLPFEIAVNDPHGFGVRYADIKKTVAYVAIDEDQNGFPVIEKWQIKMLWRKPS